MNKAYIILMALILFPCVAKAQWSFDVPSVEAYIADHKSQRSLLLARAALEQSNMLLHQYSADATEDYKELNFDLDKYTRAFDVIDVLYQSLRTGMNVHDTYSTLSGRIGDYKGLLSDYKDKVAARKGVAFSDTIILGINARAIALISAEAGNLYRSVSDLVLYATGAAACSTADLLFVLDSVNGSLDRIEYFLNRAYLDTWRYIQLRMGYWKEAVYRPRTRQEIIDGAFGRWRGAGLKPYRDD